VVATRRLTELEREILQRARWPQLPFRVALSGGADSATLAALAAKCGELIGCVHVHHGLAASDDLAAAAADIAKALESKLDVVELTVPAGPSPEANARDVRYEALEQFCSEDAAVLVGHTRDDVAETFLLNLLRGSGLKGLAGIPYKRDPNFYRPFLGVRRSETREYASLAGLGFLDDPTNLDRSIRRNEVRLDLIPRMERLNPSIVDALGRTADHLLSDSDLLEQITPGTITAPNPDLVEIPVGVLAALPEGLRVRVLARQVALLRPATGLTAAEFDRIESVARGDTSAAEMEGGLRVQRNGPSVEIRFNR